MTTITNKKDKTIWVLSDNGVDVWHLSEMISGCVCTTGQPNQRQFKTEKAALAVIPEQYRDVGL